ncbi:MAG: fibronectin type III domain-containing protein [Candidatus Moranbacteria bacterium]|nr:fibronectin type III domain-containing protein [Candidatus Moranbacteria bacterium]
MPETASSGIGFVSGSPGTRKSRFFNKKNLLVLGLILLFLAGVFVWRFISQNMIGKGPTQAAPIVAKPQGPVTAPDPTPALPMPSQAAYQSENFRVGEIAIGGEFGLIVPETDPTPLAISSVRGEAFSEKKKNSAQLVITWETNKPAVSEISYGKSVGQADGVIREEEYGTNHSVVIPDLSQASTYLYRISVHDKWGNSTESDPYAVYTGARDISLFDLMAGALGDVFGWAVKK